MTALEREFGVPIPGRVLEPGLWARTALKRLPEEGPLDWPAIFGRKAPLIVDIGCGNGRFVIGSALARPECNHLGIDILPLVLRYATRRANQRGLANVRFAACDGQRLLQRYVGRGEAAELHCYHPQPYHDIHERQKRLWTPGFLLSVHQALLPPADQGAGGLLVVQTDNRPYWEYMRSVLPALFEFQEVEGPWPDAPVGRTRREIIARRKRLKVYRGTGRPMPMSEAEAALRTASLPLPHFDAGRRRADVDRLERE